MLHVLRSTLSWLGVPFEPASGCADGDLDAVLRLEQLVGELHLAALQTAVVTSGVNVLAQGGRLENASSLKDLMPEMPAPEKVSLPRSVRQVIGVKLNSFVPTRNFFEESKAAQEDLRAFCRDVDQFGTEEAAFLDVAHLDVAWHNLSTLALAVVVALEGDVGRCLPEPYTRNTPKLKKLLIDVIRGGHPCVDANGLVKLPDLPQRRAAMRPNVHLPCVLEHHGETYQAVAKDISTGGVGLEDTPTLMPQTVVLIEFESGTCLAGLVVWSKGNRAGVKFDAPLKPNHPLLTASRDQLVAN